MKSRRGQWVEILMERAEGMGAFGALAPRRWGRSRGRAEARQALAAPLRPGGIEPAAQPTPLPSGRGGRYLNLSGRVHSQKIGSGTPGP
jgi:hypothetical protein